VVFSFKTRHIRRSDPNVANVTHTQVSTSISAAAKQRKDGEAVAVVQSLIQRRMASINEDHTEFVLADTDIGDHLPAANAIRIVPLVLFETTVPERRKKLDRNLHDASGPPVNHWFFTQARQNKGSLPALHQRYRNWQRQIPATLYT